MFRIAPFSGLGVLLVLSAGVGYAAELGDLAARVEYGFYTEDASVIAAALRELDQSPGSGPLGPYYRAYASMRLAQLPMVEKKRREDALSECISVAETLVETANLNGEASILVAACSKLAARHEVLRSVLHQRRAQQSLEQARAEEPNNPRLRLLESGAFAYDGSSDAVDEAALNQALSAFRDWPHPFELPDWGEAELLVALGAIRLADGDVRGARDFVEQALFVAPGYRMAQGLEAALREAPAEHR